MLLVLVFWFNPMSQCGLIFSVLEGMQAIFLVLSLYTIIFQTQIHINKAHRESEAIIYSVPLQELPQIKSITLNSLCI